MTHDMLLTAGPMERMVSGEKTIELRLNDEKRQVIQVGDSIRFYQTDDMSKTLLTKVLASHYFPNFAELYQHLPLKKCGYTDQNIVTAKPEDMDVYYSPERQKLYGVVGIELEVIDNIF